MSDLTDSMKTDFRETVLTEFGETVTYVPKVGSERDIEAIVDRERVETEGGAASQVLGIQVLNDATYGISSAEIDDDDQIKVAHRFGGTQILLNPTVAEVDEVMMTLEVH